MDTNSTYLAVIILAILYSFLLLFAILRYQQHFHGVELIIVAIDRRRLSRKFGTSRSSTAPYVHKLL